MKSTLKIAIQKALTKNLPLILEDAVQSLENHHLQLKRRTKTHPQRTKQIKKIQIKESATIPYFDESDEIEAQYDCPPEFWEADIVQKKPQSAEQIKKIQIKESATIPYLDESDEIEAQYDCPPEFWEADIVQKKPQSAEQINARCRQDDATIPYFDESDEIEAQYDCPPESWEDIGFEEEAAPPEADIVSEPDDESRFEAAASNPYFDDIYDQLD